jgi:hypothetical protein
MAGLTFSAISIDVRVENSSLLDCSCLKDEMCRRMGELVVVVELEKEVVGKSTF